MFSFALIAGSLAHGETSSPDFNHDIRPILANQCFKCHGPDEGTRKASLRLDTEEAATSALPNGHVAIVPGDASASELVRRITSADNDTRMPPPGTDKTLTQDQIDALIQWVEEGAVYKEHWAFVPPVRNALPKVNNKLWPRNGIDYYVLARLEAEGLEPSPEADKPTLVRRLYLDLLGLPPAPEDVDAFVNDTSAVAYEKLVDRLLASPRFGERWASWWLDMARYADSKGYEADRHRTIWRYRDWVIDAFNSGMSFKEFTIEQLAGDLLPEPTTEQLIATAFHRNTMTNDEGGTDNEEFRSAAVVDRANTTMQVWMGMTLGCAQCHSHKYDPITHDEYYQFYAFFNQTEDADDPSESPVIPTPTQDQQASLDALRAAIDRTNAQLALAQDELAVERAAWETELKAGGMQEPALSDWHVLGPFPAETFDAAFKTEHLALDKIDLAAAVNGLTWQPRPEFKDGEINDLEGQVAATYLYRTIHVDHAQTARFFLGSNDGLRVWLNNTEVLSNPILRGIEKDQEELNADLQPGENHLLLKIVNAGGLYAFYFRPDFDTVPHEVFAALDVSPAERTPGQQQAVESYYATMAPALQPYRDELARLQLETDAITQQIPTTPIMRELPPQQQRDTRVHLRGNFLNQGERVSPGVPRAFPPMPYDAPRNRLGLAHWLVDDANPLTARVQVNRFWEQFFGIGIVETSEDFGIQGEWPSHPELLDWLALDFMGKGWDMKQLIRRIVTSAAYRQASKVTPGLVERDPYNRLLARGPRFRLDAETVRDQALAASGLLSDAMHGPSVMPPQPEGIWMVVYNGEGWQNAMDDDRYRRGVYTYWRRTSPYPAMVTFDAPSREVCTVRRIRTNTPLQALVTLNDPVYIEAAQALARRVFVEADAAPAARATRAFQRVLARDPSAQELQHVVKLYESELNHYRNHAGEAQAMAQDPLGAAPPFMDKAEAAAWTVVCNVILNLDETLTKR